MARRTKGNDCWFTDSEYLLPRERVELPVVMGTKFKLNFFWCSRIGITTRMQFDGFDAQFPGFRDLSHVGINKQAAHDTSALKLIDAWADSLEVRLHIQSALGCNLREPFGNKGHLIRHKIQSDLCDFVGDRHFQIQADTADFF